MDYIKGPYLYINDADHLKAWNVAVDLYSEVIISNNFNFIFRVEVITMYYWAQTHRNWWTETHYSEGLIFLVNIIHLKEIWRQDKLCPRCGGLYNSFICIARQSA